MNELRQRWQAMSRLGASAYGRVCGDASALSGLLRYCSAVATAGGTVGTHNFP